MGRRRRGKISLWDLVMTVTETREVGPLLALGTSGGKAASRVSEDLPSRVTLELVLQACER